MGKTINYEKLQDVVIGAFGKDSSGISADEVMARINANAIKEVTNDDNVDNDVDNNDSNDTNATTGDDNTNTTNDNVDNTDTNAINDNTVNNDNIDNNDNNDNNDVTDTIVDDVNNAIVLSDSFKSKFDIEEFEEDKILAKIKTLEDEKTALILEKEKIQREIFIKEKGITSEVFEALSGSTLKEKEEALKKVINLSGFKLNSSKDIKAKEIKFNSSF